MARDFYHQQVKNALIKDGWRITHDPYKIKIEEVQYEMDLAAIGQFVDYSVFLEEVDPNRVLFLAIPETIHQTFFQKKIIQKTIQKILAKLIINYLKVGNVATLRIAIRRVRYVMGYQRFTYNFTN